ncbi:molybdenum cofactor biosynthesis protein MoaE [Methylomonas rapida]|uniref:Molybdopterin synthase catalytic subunit n=1 Tax=Methylomonas rapida TaxID=2963939 RepID=A0ABY7GNK4_9GAMM|nr:molybdenum cofactor biosynthesis protein MoaE [Methylomonas rapida]WAR46092.1 molybdenum cofactor biosynthesis protein MoaE [Methylomonas rapida]
MKNNNYFVQGGIDPIFIGEQIAMYGSKHDIGAHSIFLGQVRADVKVKKQVSGIEYSTYEDMANEAFSKIREEAFEKWSLSCLYIFHSIGLVNTGELSLFVFCSSGHRRESIKAMEKVVEDIKHKIPIWKKEVMTDQSACWVYK